MKPQLVVALSVLVFLVVTNAGCANQRLAAQCRWVGDDGLVRYSGCTTPITGEYIVSLGMDTEANIITDIYGRYGIKSVKEVTTTLQGKQHVRLFLVAITEDPGHRKMYELASKATGLIRPYVNVTPNYGHYVHQPADELVNCVVGGERRWTQRSKCD